MSGLALGVYVGGVMAVIAVVLGLEVKRLRRTMRREESARLARNVARLERELFGDAS